MRASKVQRARPAAEHGARRLPPPAASPHTHHTQLVKDEKTSSRREKTLHQQHAFQAQAARTEAQTMRPPGVPVGKLGGSQCEAEIQPPLPATAWVQPGRLCEPANSPLAGVTEPLNHAGGARQNTMTKMMKSVSLASPCQTLPPTREYKWVGRT